MFTPNGLWYGRSASFEVHSGILDRVACKIVLGLFYLAREQPLPKTHAVYLGSKCNKLTFDIMTEMSPSLTPEIGFGDDVFLWRFTGWRDDPAKSFWHLIFYRTLLICGATLPVDDGRDACGPSESMRVA